MELSAASLPIYGAVRLQDSAHRLGSLPLPEELDDASLIGTAVSAHALPERRCDELCPDRQHAACYTRWHRCWRHKLLSETGHVCTGGRVDQARHQLQCGEHPEQPDGLQHTGCAAL